MPFRIALSGLNASSEDLRVIGNNVANANTTGFKQSRSEFSDIFAASNLGVTQNAIGAGVKIADVAQQFTQGNIEFTNNNLDLALSGQGFFIMNDNGSNVYTRAGEFAVDRDGYVVNSQQQRLTVFQADSTGNITGATGPLQLDRSDIAPKASTSIQLDANLDASAAPPGGLAATGTIALTPGTQLDTTTSPYTTPNFTIYDRLGNPSNAALQFTYTGTGSQWDVQLLVGGAPTTPPTTATGVNVGTDTVALSWDPDGAGGQTPVSISLDTGNITSASTGGSTVVGSADGSSQSGFDPTNASTYNSSTSVTIYDSLGTQHLATMYFRKNGIPNQWETYTYVDGVQQSGPDIVEFASDGSIQTTTYPSTLTIPGFDPGGGAAAMNLTVDLGKTTQYGSQFSVNNVVQDGYTTGQLSGIDIAENGIITSRFTNGQSRTLGEVAIANFNNPQGLRELGNASWAESFDSGAPLVGQPGTGSLGLIQSGALEGSNVDITEQLVNMITAQRNFQANAQVIQTADAITQTIINIR